ncbi:BLUF domain-containing protein [Mucilaginibacter lutimaris]|uniref:BLUF domain-containing protein n=1 Tax=Mucilaginibacter lutimaris TaxID=931629 RepID=A0ABW2ZLR6_9SPHI
MKNIVYLSTAVTLLNDDQLIDILTSARKNNAERNVSGMLLYSEGTFIQVLEGEDTQVDAIFAKIETDPRHKNLITLINGSIVHKNFAEWAMGFTTVNTAKVADLLGYLKSMDSVHEKSDNNAAIITLKTFIETNKLVIRS